MSDIILDTDVVIIEGDAVEFHVTDVKIDSPARRKTEGGWRRALVHNDSDGLTINFASDYPDGVTIEGRTKLDAIVGKQATVQEVIVDRRVKGDDGEMRMPATEPASVPDVTIAAGGVRPGFHVKLQTLQYLHNNRRALQHNSSDGLTINVDSDYPGGVTINGDVTLPGRLVVNGQDMALAIQSHEDRIRQLEAQVAKLLGA